MSTNDLLTAEQFARTKSDLPEGGRWVELDAGRVTTLDPPDDAHGTAVLNFSKALAVYFQSPDAAGGYAAFEIGLVVARAPDTVRCPAISCFLGGSPFAESDHTVTEARPRVVVEMASTHGRRSGIEQRVQEYLDWGVEAVWVADTVNEEVLVARRGLAAKRLRHRQRLAGVPILPGFSVGVADLFAVPEWWSG